MILKRIASLLLLVFLYSFVSKAQSPLQLVVYIDPGTPPGFKQQIFLKAYMKNVTSRVVKISKPTPYAMWRTDKDSWILTKNGQPQQAFKFVERPDRRMNNKDLLNLAPGDSIFVSVYRWDLDTEGVYEAKLMYEQIKANIEKAYVHENLVKDREDFSLVSNTLKIEIKKPAVVVNSEILDYNKLINNTRLFYGTEQSEIYREPNSIYKLQLKTGKEMLNFPDLKNVQYLFIEKMDLDSIPQMMADWNLQYLYMFKATAGGNFSKVPANFCSGKNLRFLLFNYGTPDKLPDWMFGHKKLEYLRIFDTRIVGLDDRFAEFTELQTLDLANIEGLTTIPSYFSRFTKLEELTLYTKGLVDVSALENLPNLKVLRIMDKDITKDNESLKKIKQKNKAIAIFTLTGMVM